MTPALTRRQRQVLQSAADGFRREETAHVLGVRDDTVKHHLEAARRRLRARTTAQAVATAIAQGQIVVDVEVPAQ